MKKNYQLTFFISEDYLYQNETIIKYLERICQKLKIPGITHIKSSSKELEIEIIMNFDENDYLKLFTYLEKEPLNFFYTKTAIENAYNLIEIFIVD